MSEGSKDKAVFFPFWTKNPVAAMKLLPMDITASTITVEHTQFITVQVIQSGKCHSIVLVTMYTEVYLQIRLIIIAFQLSHWQYHLMYHLRLQSHWLQPSIDTIYVF